MARKEDKLRPYRVDYFDIDEMRENDQALVNSVVVRAVTSKEAEMKVISDPSLKLIANRVIVRSYRFYKTLGDRKKLVYKAVEDLFTANKAIKVMEHVEGYRAAKLAPPVVAAPIQPGEHVTRMSDSSLYDEVCVNCGATDTSGKLEDPCPGAHAPTWSGGLKIPVATVTEAAAALGVDPQVLAAHAVDAVQKLSGPLSPATVAAVADLQGMINHDAHEQTMDTFVPNSVPDGKQLPDPTNTAPITSFVQPEDLIEPGKAVGPAGRPRVPHWHGCACDVCETPSISGTDITPLVTVTGIWERIAPVLGFGAVLAFVIYAVIKILHH
jgi:hypothetical protein